MRKWKHVKKTQDQNRWVISYADFITLLFAFFVVMYSLSSVNEGKYRQLSKSLEKAFKISMNSLDPISIGEKTDFLTNYDVEHNFNPINQSIHHPDLENEYSQEIPVSLIEEDLKKNFKGLIDSGQIDLRDDQNWLEIEIKSGVLFSSGGSYIVTREAKEIIQKLSDTLKKINNPVTVEGHTDNVPINNNIFPSNWELSADRAATIVRELIENGITSSRLAALGYADNFPISDNKTDKNREENRRVVILIEKTNKRRDYLFRNKIKQETGVNLDIFAPLDENLFNFKKEVVITPKKPIGNEIQGIKMPDGTIRYNASGIHKKQ